MIQVFQKETTKQRKKFLENIVVRMSCSLVVPKLICLLPPSGIAGIVHHFYLAPYNHKYFTKSGIWKAILSLLLINQCHSWRIMPNGGDPIYCPGPFCVLALYTWLPQERACKGTLLWLHGMHGHNSSIRMKDVWRI